MSGAYIGAFWEACGPDFPASPILVVDADIDVRRLQQVFWAWSIHARPETDVMVSGTGAGDSGARMGIDATTKTEAEGLKRPMPDRVVMDPEVVAKVDEHWEADGFPKVG